MKVLFIAPHLSTGGMPQYLYKQMEAISSDCEVWCIEWDNVTGGVLVVQRNRIVNLLGNRLITLGENRENLFSFIKEINPDVIHLQEIPEMFMPYKIALRLYDPKRTYTIIETSHDSSFNIENKLHFPDKFLMVSQYQINTYEPLGIPCELVEYPIEYHKRTKTREELLDQLGLDPNKKHIITVGLFTPRKNQAEVIEYAKQLQNYPVQFHFIGNQADNFKYYWEPLMKDFPPNCKWWGERNDVDLFYQVADLFLFTSRGSNTDKETMPLVIRESISWQVPSLIYDLDVYLNYFDKHKNIEYLDFNNKIKNTEKIVEKLGIEINQADQYFDITFDKSDNKIHLSYKKLENKKYKVSIKDKDSNAPIYWFEAEFGGGTTWWIIPIPIHAFDFYNDLNFGSFLIEFYDEQNNLQFDKIIQLKEVKSNKPKLNLKNPFDCLFNNYNEMFVDKKYDCYELDKMETVFDIGANSGLFSLLAINKGAKKVYAFEPNQESLVNLKQITKNLNVEVIEKAVYTKDENLTFYIDPTNTTIGSLSENHLNIHAKEIEKITVPAISLKTFIEQNNIEKVSMVKMDIEGAEYEIIENLEDEVFNKIDSFLIEFHDNENHKVKAITDKLTEKGYHIDQVRNQNTKNNDEIKGSYLESPIGTIYAKKLSVFPKTYIKYTVDKSNINIHDMYNGHFKTTYKGIPYLKCPMDYVLYQMIIMDIQPDLIIEIGTLNGGGALYYADLLYLLGKGEVHTINVRNEVYDQRVFNHPKIKFFNDGFENYDLSITKNFEKVLVIDDASHFYSDVLAALNKFSSVVSKDSYFIVEDGVIDFVGYTDYFKGGPRRAIDEFLQNNDDFIIDRNYCDFFGVNATYNPDGYLKRVK